MELGALRIPRGSSPRGSIPGLCRARAGRTPTGAGEQGSGSVTWRAEAPKMALCLVPSPRQGHGAGR